MHSKLRNAWVLTKERGEGVIDLSPAWWMWPLGRGIFFVLAGSPGGATEFAGRTAILRARRALKERVGPAEEVI